MWQGGGNIRQWTLIEEKFDMVGQGARGSNPTVEAEASISLMAASSFRNRASRYSTSNNPLPAS
jgi:hypothetical protein